MENIYGIGVKNRYDLLYDDIDPYEVLKQQEEERERRKAEKLQKLKAEKSKQSAPSSKKGQNKEQSQNATVPKHADQQQTDVGPLKSRPRQQTEQRSRRDDDNHEERKNRHNKDDFRSTWTSETSGARDRADRSEEPGERGRGRGRGGRGRGGGGRGRGRGTWESGGRGRRDFDRGGSQNRGASWSKDNTFNDSPQEEPPPDEMMVDQDVGRSSPQPPQDPSPKPTEGAGEVPGQEAAIPTEETEEKNSPREMTLDEWKQQEMNQRSIPHFNLRQPGEGEDPSHWKKLYRLNNKKAENESMEEEEEEEEFGRKGRGQKQLVEIQINFSDSRRGMRGRGSRGGRGRGMPGRGGTGSGGGGSGSGSSSGGGPSQHHQKEQHAPRVDDWNDFPSLVTA